MHDPARVRHIERGHHLPRDVERAVNGERTARDEPVETLAVDELEDQKLCAVGFVNAVDRADVRMIERGQDLRFAPESGERLGVLERSARENLEGDLSTEFGIAGAIDLAHSTFAQLGDDLVSPQH